MSRSLGAFWLIVCLCLGVALAQEFNTKEFTSVAGCNNGDTSQLTPGIPDCHVRNSLGANSSVIYSFNVGNSSVGNMSVVAVARILNGLVNMVLYAPGSTPSGMPDDVSRTLYQNLASSEKFVHVPARKLKEGRYFIKISSYSGNPTFTLSVFTPRAKLRLVPSEVSALKELQQQCCKSTSTTNSTLQAEFDACSTFAAATNETRTFEDDYCQQAPNVCDANGRLTRMIIPFGGLACPSFPSSFSAFSKLKTLDLTMNDMPSKLDDVVQVLSTLPNLQHLYLRYLGLSGQLSCDLHSLLPNLQTIALTGNQLAGTIPDCLLQSKTLSELYLSRNNLTGALPAFPTASSLTVFYATAQAGTGLSGTIPPSLATCQNLLHLDISRNALTGTIPPLPSALLYLNASANQLEGRLPALPAFTIYFDVNSNKLSGSLQDLAPLSQLYYVDTSNNQFEGRLPDLPSTLNVADFSGNKHTGQLPALPASLRWFGAADNQLSGAMDDVNIGSAYYVYLSNNKLTGGVPRSALSSALSEFDLSSNQLSGSIPDGWTAPSLTSLDLSNNQFTGSIPSSLGTLVSLTHLDLSANKLTGGLSGFVSALNNAYNTFAYLNVSSNGLSGAIPSGLQNLAIFDKTNLLLDPYTGTPQDRILDLSYNTFSGAFPSYVYKYLGDVEDRCGCTVSVNISGPSMSLSCPNGTNATLPAAVTANSKLECIAADGRTADYGNYLATGDLTASRSAGGSGGAKPSAAIVAVAVIVSIIGFALLAAAGYFAYRRYRQDRRSQSFQSMKDSQGIQMTNPLEPTGVQV